MQNSEEFIFHFWLKQVYPRLRMKLILCATRKEQFVIFYCFRKQNAKGKHPQEGQKKQGQVFLKITFWEKNVALFKPVKRTKQFRSSKTFLCVTITQVPLTISMTRSQHTSVKREPLGWDPEISIFFKFSRGFQ